MRGRLKAIALLPILLLSLFSKAQMNLDSIQELVDSEIAAENQAGLIALAEYHFPKNDSLSKYILSRVELESSELEDTLYRALMIRKSELIKRLYDHRAGLIALDKALNYSKFRKDSISIAKWYELKASHFYYTFEYDSCQSTLDKAIELLEILGLESEKGSIILKSAAVNYAIGNYEEAITKAFQATEIFKLSDEAKQLGVSYLQLGNIHYFLKSYDEAQTYYDLSAVHFKKANDEFGYNNAISNLGLIYIEKENYTKGIHLQHMALRHFRKEKRYLEEGNTYYYLGKAHSGLNNYDSSDYYLGKSIKANQESDYNIGISYAYWIKSTNFLGRKLLDSALYYNTKGLEIIKGVKSYEIEKKLQEQRSQLLEKTGKPKEALLALKRSLELDDSLDIDFGMLENLARSQRAKLESTEYELKMARKQGAEQASENKKQEQLILAISIIAFLLIFFVIGLVLTNKRNKSLHLQLLENKDTIESELDNKKALLKEIHHRVKNNLQIISSMLSIQAQYIENEQLDAIINECRSRIVSMSLIHESLYRKEDDDRSLFSNYIKQLLPQLIETYHIDKSKVELEMNIEDFELSLDDSVPCGLMINEIVSNSLKHGFSDGRNGKIMLSMKKRGKEIFLKISDNGSGLPPNFEPEEQDSFGFLLIYTLAHQLEADISIANENGVAFNIRWETKDDKMLS